MGNKTFKRFLIETALKTQKGSPIKRSNWGVGKQIGGFVYLHRDYINLIPEDKYKEVTDAYNTVVDVTGAAPEFNVIKVGKNKSVITFINSPDFDTSPEPTVGEYINVNLDTDNVRPGRSNSIWHHKWLWVQDDYSGFDVQESIERSKQWLGMDDIDFKRIGNRDFWNREVASKLN